MTVLPGNTEMLKVHGEKVVKALVAGFSYIDEETGEFVSIIPTFNLVSVGATEKEAMEFQNFQVDRFMQRLNGLGGAKFFEVIHSFGFQKVKNSLIRRNRMEKNPLTNDELLHSYDLPEDLKLHQHSVAA